MSVKFVQVRLDARVLYKLAIVNLRHNQSLSEEESHSQ